MTHNIIEFTKLKIALISDELTEMALSHEADIRVITSTNYKSVLNSKIWKPDFLFVESAWKGYKNKWKYRVATFPEVRKKQNILRKLYKFYHVSRGNKRLAKIVNFAKENDVPTVFWNKEDGIHFNRFINSAKLFDHIFTVDENCIPKYKEVVDSETTVNALLFAIEPRLHNFTGVNFKHEGANFVGSYSQHIHNRRREWQEMMFDALQETGLELAIYDRNSNRKSDNYRYPKMKNTTIKDAIPYNQTAQVYKDYMISLNVNTIEDSPTMFSRRLIEIMACGGIAITNPSPAVDKYFKEYCYVVNDKQEMLALFERLKSGLTEEDLEKIQRGAEYIAKEHTWRHRLQEICEVIGVKYA
jgi:spore maturation protein CgeB